MSGAAFTPPPSDSLLLLPPRPGALVLEQDAARVEVLADFIGTREVACLPRLAAFGDQALDFLDRNRRLGVLCLAYLHHTEDLVEVVERLLNQHGVGLPELVAI